MNILIVCVQRYADKVNTVIVTVEGILHRFTMEHHGEHLIMLSTYCQGKRTRNVISKHYDEYQVQSLKKDFNKKKSYMKLVYINTVQLCFFKYHSL